MTAIKCFVIAELYSLSYTYLFLCIYLFILFKKFMKILLICPSLGYQLSIPL